MAACKSCKSCRPACRAWARPFRAAEGTVTELLAGLDQRGQGRIGEVLAQVGDHHGLGSRAENRLLILTGPMR